MPNLTNASVDAAQAGREEARPRPLFVVGSKRSGSTLMANLLNAHPRVFVSHESDVLWILYQARNGPPARYVRHPLDSELMMDATVRRCRRVLAALGHPPTHGQIVDAFHGVQERVMDAYFHPPLDQRIKRAVLKAGKDRSPRGLLRAFREQSRLPPKRDLAWTGDKKHAQYLDPELRPFVGEHFPGARYVHVVRDPRGAVASVLEAARKWKVMPDYFRGTAAEVLERWAIHEEWALRMKEEVGDAFLTVRLEDLWREPRAVAHRLLDFLELETTDEFEAMIPRLIHPRDPNEKYASFTLPEVPRALRIVEIHGYEAGSLRSGEPAGAGIGD
ncbi:MAG TPA: sulfotransferase [Longimicrobium sp.]|nr:sulfotransferase [Longimicrobium sp.]